MCSYVRVGHAAQQLMNGGGVMGGECGREAFVRIIGEVLDGKRGLKDVDGTDSVDTRHRCRS